MKKLSYLILLLSLLTAGAFSQQRGLPNARQKIEAARIGWITTRLDLTPEEAQQFWPVYTSYQKELAALNLENRRVRQNENAGKDADTDDELEFDSRRLELKKRYRKEFLRVLPQQKVAILYRAEREFTDKLIRELNTRRGKKGAAGPN